jgi:hypothetical protein
LNTLNQRTSAHYIEINYIYAAEMLKRVYFYWKNSYLVSQSTPKDH